jgi:hypothetical protein
MVHSQHVSHTGDKYRARYDIRDVCKGNAYLLLSINHKIGYLFKVSPDYSTCELVDK